jgi:hypothetical protein
MSRLWAPLRLTDRRRQEVRAHLSPVAPVVPVEPAVPEYHLARGPKER